MERIKFRSKFIQLNKYYYRCEVTRMMYILSNKKVSNSDTLKFRCVSRLNKDQICSKYKEDVILTEGKSWNI